ncbi:MAG: helix-hairpin-helix domain-containing protein [Rhodoferax sp.]|nr:helix-hairpin-helix domain-containing protein [Rhodoferax sp.]
MKSRITKYSVIAFTLLLTAGLCAAADGKSVAPQQAASKTAVSPPSAKTRSEVNPKVIAKVKLVNINGANKEELKTLPGISDAEADKIIAGRPYGSKAHLLTHNIVSAAVYDGLKSLVIAKQPTNDAGKNAELYKKK